VFPQPQVKSLFARYVLVQLYVDYKENEAFLLKEFNTLQLPLYAVVEPTGDGKFRKVAVYEEGKINDVNGFVEFLRKNLPAGAVAAR
jgi:hypothetical protein